MVVELPYITSDASLQITDNLGRIVMQQNITSATTQVAFSHMPGGIYFVCVSDGAGATAVNKLVVVH